MPPVDLERFEQGEVPSGVRQSTVTPAVKEFLSENSDQAWTTKEIADAIDANRATVNHVVRKLSEKGAVERRMVDGKIHNLWTGEPEPVAE